ncbi:MAG: hypothetical protein ACR2K5_11345 [Pseudolabrys sp.]
MTTTYALLLARCGLSQSEAAAFHDVRPDTVKSWSAGRNQAPPGVIAELRVLYAQIEKAADAAIAEISALMKEQKSDEIEMGLARNDAEAQQLGMPCVGAHRAMIGMVAATVPIKIAVVPRGAGTL